MLEQFIFQAASKNVQWLRRLHCRCLIEPHLATLRKIEILAVRSTNETPPIFWVFNSPSPAPGAMDPRGRGGTSADIVPTQMKFGVDPPTRCWDIAQKPTKCKNSPLTPIVTKISFPLFFRAPGAANPQKERRHIRNQNTPACKTWLESARGLSINRWLKKQNKHTVKLIPRPSL